MIGLRYDLTLSERFGIKAKVPRALNNFYFTFLYKNLYKNDCRFLTFGLSENYLRLCLSTKNFKVHRVICYAFHPIDGKNTLSNYSDLQVNHKDGNTINNHADNLEWVTSRENMFHCYSHS